MDISPRGFLKDELDDLDNRQGSRHLALDIPEEGGEFGSPRSHEYIGDFTLQQSIELVNPSVDGAETNFSMLSPRGCILPLKQMELMSPKTTIPTDPFKPSQIEPEVKTLINSQNQLKLNTPIKKEPQQHIRVAQVSSLTYQQPPGITKEAKSPKYTEQMLQDLEALKANSKRVKHQQSHKKFKTGDNRVNQTMEVTKKPVSTSNSNVPEELRIFVKVAFEKKKENYNRLMEWDKNRATTMAFYRNMLEVLQVEVDRRVQASFENMKLFIDFFKKKAKYEEQHHKQAFTPINVLLSDNPISRSVFLNCNVVINALCEQFARKIENSYRFSILIKERILNDLCIRSFQQSQKRLFELRQIITSFKSTLIKLNSEAEAKSCVLTMLFTNHGADPSNMSDQDFYLSQLQFLSVASQQIEVQKNLGIACLDYYIASVEEQRKRSQILKAAMMRYIEGLQQFHGIQMEEAQLQQARKSEELRLIHQYYSFEEIFDPRTAGGFRKMRRIKPNEDITLEVLQAFINQHAFEPFSSRVLLLKEFNTRFVTKGKEKEEEDCYTVITVDGYLHLFLPNRQHEALKKDEANEVKKDERSTRQSLSVSRKLELAVIMPTVSLRISKKEMEVKQGKECTLEIIKKEQRRGSMFSYLWDSKNDKSYRLRFGKPDLREEFIDYMNKLLF